MFFMSYYHHGKINPFDAYMAGFNWWTSPRQTLILAEMFQQFTPAPGIETEAFEDMKSQIEHEAKIKRKKYLGGCDV